MQNNPAFHKKFKLRPEQIRPIAPGRGACYATDSIVVDGHKVGLMYRQRPGDEHESGWTFLSGVESQQYLDDAVNTAIYDVNTIANYDPDVVPYLDSPIGTAFERDETTGQFRQTEAPPED